MGQNNANGFEGRGPFFMVASKMENSAGIIVSGRIQRGIVAVGKKIDVYDQTGKKGEAIVQTIKIFGKTLPDAAWGDPVSITLSGLQTKDINEGDFLAEPGSIEFSRIVKARVWLLPKSEGGFDKAVKHGHNTALNIGSMVGTGRIGLFSSSREWNPDEEVELEIDLSKPILVDNRPTVAMLDGQQVYAKGTIVDRA